MLRIGGVMAAGMLSVVQAEQVVEEWPHFLGPHLNATTKEGPLLEKWPEAGLKIVWEEETGDGYAAPILAEGRLYYFHRVGDKETLECRKPETGEKIWSYDFEVEYRDRYGFSPGPRASAVVSEGKVYVAGVTAQLHCVTAEKGEFVWKKDLMAEYEVPQYFFGYGPTPVVHGDRLIVNVGGKAKEDGSGVSVAAFDKKTGKVLWEVEDKWGASYASPVVAKIQGKDVALVLAAGESKPAHGGLLTIDVKSGEVYDRFSWRARKYESVLASSPLAVDDKRVFISDCYEKGGVLLEFDEDLMSRPVWMQREFGMHFMMPIVKDGYLYGFAGRNPPDTEFKCVNLESGDLAWTKDYRWEKEDGQIEGLFRASILQAGERYFALGEDGILAEVKLTPKGPELVQRSRLFTAREAWTLPTLHKGLLYVVQNTSDGMLRKKARMICYDLRVK